jgi:hypothetical protein
MFLYVYKFYKKTKDDKATTVKDEATKPVSRLDKILDRLHYWRRDPISTNVDALLEVCLPIVDKRYISLL